jgi:hypothetical protein
LLIVICFTICPSNVSAIYPLLGLVLNNNYLLFTDFMLVMFSTHNPSGSTNLNFIQYIRHALVLVFNILLLYFGILKYSGSGFSTGSVDSKCSNFAYLIIISPYLCKYLNSLFFDDIGTDLNRSTHWECSRGSTDDLCVVLQK